ncbi:hypothetical protein AARAC_003551 [Aspergillus arachidicola]|uniref:MEI5 protein n=1 Tax=Aspergillus arachidicola TaxID=656916 RepID=A0A2G7GAP4_9EURO|nr:hypothetical protein AARAC_003551 [Aspergillus arachidicola]
MPPKTLTSPSIPSPNAHDQHGVRAFLDQLKKLASNSGFDAILGIYDENNKLLDHLKSKDHDIENLKDEMKEQERKNDTAVDQMFKANEKEKSRHQETKEHVKTLQTLISDKEKCISERDKVVDGLEKKVKKLEFDISKEREKSALAQKEINGLQKSVQEKETTINKMQTMEADLKDKLVSTNKKVKELENNAAVLNGSLMTTEASLKKLEGYAVKYSAVTEQSVIENLGKLWDYAKTEIFAILKNDLPSDSLQNISAWEKLRQRELVQEHQIPLPCSNTLAAKQMRLVIILAILAREINTHIFLPVYIARVDNQYNPFRQVLTNEAGIDSEKESFCRSILLSLDPPTQDSICLVGIQTVVKNVSEYLYELLPEDQRLAFHNTLSKVVQKAAIVWKPIQHSKRRYVLDFDPPTADDEYEVFTFPSTDKTTTEKNANQKNPQKIFLTVLPRLSIIENKEITAYTAPIQLNRSQYQWINAESEMNKEPPSPTIGRIPWRRRSNTPKNLSLSNGGSRKGNGA